MAQTDRSSSLTTILLFTHEDQYSSATEHAFLAKAGDGTLPDPAVCKWLVQDKYYQLAYVNFIGALLAKLDLLPSVFPSHSAERQVGGENLSRTTFDLLVDSLTAIRQEIDFYDKTADKYKLELQYAPPSKTTEEYMNLFADASVKEVPLLHGLVVLWATEHCYHRAWTYASRQTESAAQSPFGGGGSDTGAVAALHKEFIPNWTSEQFGGFVEKLASVTDAWAAQAGDREHDTCQRLWARVLQLETEFWPEV
ncbi:MAG: hypothetical protein Q9191_005909 [Dirinaria sp. TL-2023a]